jgi:hypothetical protein
MQAAFRYWLFAIRYSQSASANFGAVPEGRHWEADDCRGVQPCLGKGDPME